MTLTLSDAIPVATRRPGPDAKRIPFAPTHVSTWFKPSWISMRILREPTWSNGRLARGAMILNQVDPLVERWPQLRKLYILIERHGWFGPNESGYADIALVEDLSVWERLRTRDPEIIHLPLGPADFVDTDRFRPIPVERPYDVVQISCWSRRKRIELLIEAAAKLPHRSFVHLGHFENSGSTDELRYRDECIALAAKLGANISFPFGHIGRNEELVHDKDAVNSWINRARIGVLTAMPEGINRFKMECLAADRPMLVGADAGTPTTKHIKASTGALFPPTAEGLAEAIERTLSACGQFHPREYLLRETGRRRSLARLQHALRESARRTNGVDQFEAIDWDGRNESLAWGREAVGEILEALARHGSPARHPSVDEMFWAEEPNRA